MRIASFNVENLFARARALNLPTRSAGRKVPERHPRINTLFNRSIYTKPVKVEILRLINELGLPAWDDGGDWAILRQNRSRLLTRHKKGTVEVVASDRQDWIGWVELKTEAADELVTRHTAMVIRDVKATCKPSWRLTTASLCVSSPTSC